MFCKQLSSIACRFRLLNSLFRGVRFRSQQQKAAAAEPQQGRDVDGLFSFARSTVHFSRPTGLPGELSVFARRGVVRLLLAYTGEVKAWRGGIMASGVPKRGGFGVVTLGDDTAGCLHAGSSPAIMPSLWSVNCISSTLIPAGGGDTSRVTPAPFA